MSNEYKIRKEVGKMRTISPLKQAFMLKKCLKNFEGKGWR